MARTKEFDPEVALAAAQEVFWRCGYEAASMSQLVAAMGIGRASVYATFGGKHELFLKALDRYADEHDTRVMTELSRPGPALPAVRAVIQRYADAAVSDAGTGCLITNTATELLPADTGAARRVLASWDTLEALLAGALIRAHAQGELAAERDPRALARLLVVLLQGIRVTGKAGACPARITDATTQALNLLG